MSEFQEPEGNYKTGWIRVYRSIRNHWLYEPNRKRTKLEAWYDLLLQAKHGQQKETIGYDLITIERGQILTSQDKLSRDWRWDRSSVRSFLHSLHEDQMLTIETTNKFTMITICNYDTYQDNSPTLSPSNQHQINTTSTHTIINKNDKKNINLELSADCETIINYLNVKARKGFRTNSKKTISLISSRKKDGFKLSDFMCVIDFKVSQWINDDKMNEYLKPETLFSEKFEGYLQASPKIKEQQYTSVISMSDYAKP